MRGAPQRYRDACQVVSSRTGFLPGLLGDEGAAMRSDGVDRVKELPHTSRLVHARGHVPFGGHIDPHEAHSHPFRRGWSGASEPVPMLTLVHARTPGAPQDTVRVLSTGRGRQSLGRGHSLKGVTATLSRIPSRSPLPSSGSGS
jgi:hypothetical protein